MDATMSVDSGMRTNQCKTCRKSISIYTRFKNCDVCRARNRIKESHRLERKRETEQFLTGLRSKDMNDAPYGDEENFNAKEDLIERTEALPRSLSTGTMTTKPRLPKLYELEGKEKNAAMQEMKMCLIKKIQDSGGGLPAAYNEDEVMQSASGNAVKSVPEFQTASALYEKLKVKACRASDAGKKLKFHGCHSIIAVPTIAHQQRVTMVAKDLRKIARIIFTGRSRKSERMSDGSLFQTYFDCNCLGTSSTASGSSGASRGTLKHLIVHPMDEPVECGGSVKVTAETDLSHPAGIIGQKISVHIYH